MHQDDGSTLSGIGVAIACIICLFIGYAVRDAGYQIQFNQQPMEVRR